MEFQSYLILLRRRWWVLLLMSVAGVLGAIVYSSVQPPVFQSTTRLMVLRSPEGALLDMGYMSESHLAETYAWLLLTEDVRDKTSLALGIPILPHQISVQPVENTHLLDVIVEANDGAVAAQIANTLLSTFISENERLLAGRFASLEESLLAQLTEVRAQIDGLQGDVAETSEESLKEQLQAVEAQLSELRQTNGLLQREIADLEQMADFRLVTSGVWSGKPTPSVQQRGDIAIMRDRLAEVQRLLALYQEIQVNLTVPAGAPSSAVGHTDQMEATLALYQQIYSSLLSDYESVRLARLKSTPNVVQVEAARPPSNPIRPRPLQNALIGAMAGLLVGACGVFMAEYADNTIHGPEETTNVLGLPVLGCIPEIPSPKARADRSVHLLLDPQSPALDAFLFVRTNLEAAARNHRFRTILVTSPGPAEGKTTVVVNLGIAMAQGGHRVLLVDADLRRPAMHRPFELRQSPGLSEWLRGLHDDLPVHTACSRELLSVLTAGDSVPDPIDLLVSTKMADLQAIFHNRPETVILDSPPVSLPDTSVLVAHADAIVLVLRPGHTTVNAAQASMEQLARMGGSLVGVVLNRIPRSRMDYFGGYMAYARRYYVRPKLDAGGSGIDHSLP